MAGRPRFIPSESQRETVREMRKYAYPLAAIAKQVGVSIPTLKKAFDYELRMSDPALRTAIVLKLMSKALDGVGNVSALRILCDELDVFAGARQRQATFSIEPARSDVDAYVDQTKGLRREEERFFRENLKFNGGRPTIAVKPDFGNPEVTRRIQEAGRRAQAQES